MLADELRLIVGGEVWDDAETRHRYGTDASAFRIEPVAVVAPRSVADLGKLVAFVNERRKSGDTSISLTARGGGSDMTGGPLSDSIVVDCTPHLNQTVRIDDDSVTAESGAFYRDIERETLKRHRIFPCYPASKALATIGGIVANNSAGEKTLKYGQTWQYVRSLRAVLADGHEHLLKRVGGRELAAKCRSKTFEGRLYKQTHDLLKSRWSAIKGAEPKTSKNSSGYLLWHAYDPTTDSLDLAQLLIGAQGTLGIVTEATLGLVPTARHTQMLVLYLRSLDQLSEIVHCLRSFKPSSIELFDDATLRLALRYAPQLAKMIGTQHNLLRLAWQFLPDAHIIAVRGFPKLVLMAEFEGDDDRELSRTLDTTVKSVMAFDVPTVRAPGTSAERYWVVRRQSFNLLRTKLTGVQTVPFIDDLVIDPDRLTEFLPRLYAILADYPQLRFSIAGHAGNGNLHIFPLIDMTRQGLRDLIPTIADRVYQLVLEFHGSLSAEHNDGLIRGPYLEQMYGREMVKVMRQIKQIFDPQGIFYPPQKLDETKDYSFAHLKTDNEHTV